jgi:hypothetical protein
MQSNEMQSDAAEVIENRVAQCGEVKGDQEVVATMLAE